MPGDSEADAWTRRRETAIGLLAGWFRSSRSQWQTGEDDQTGWYGSGYDGWGVQTALKHAAAAAVLARFGPIDLRTDARRRARAGLRYALAGHVSAESSLSDGNQWGHTWISALALERAAHGVHLLWDGLDDGERGAWIRVLASEAEWLTNDYHRGSSVGITAGRWGDSGLNAPESNLWNGSLLWRTASILPDDPRAEGWRARGVRFLANALSIAADSTDRSIIDGAVIADEHRGANYFDSWALDHHGYLNTGYMAVVVSQASIMHFDLLASDVPAPDILLRHQSEHWERLRLCIADDGRLLSPGGDSRTRYSYCHDLMAPALLFAHSALGDEQAARQLDGWLELVRVEQESNEDTSFMGLRLEHLASTRPAYLERLESDRAFALSFVAAHASQADGTPPGGVALGPMTHSWTDEEHGFAVERGANRFASFSWRAFGTATGLCIPPGRSDLGEWDTNLTPSLRFEGEDLSYSGFGSGAPARRVDRRSVQQFTGGFATLGTISEGVDLRIPEGWSGTDAALSTVCFVALPDDQTVVGFHLTDVGSWRPGILESHGLNLEVPNDVYNGGSRRYTHESGVHETRRDDRSEAPLGGERVSSLGQWAMVDEDLGIASLDGQDLCLIEQRARRGGALKSLGVDRVTIAPVRSFRRAAAHERVVDAAWALQTRPTADGLQRLTESVRWVEQSTALRALTFRTAGTTWGLIANLSNAAVPVPAQMPIGCRDITAGILDRRAELPAHSVRLLMLGGRDNPTP